MASITRRTVLTGAALATGATAIGLGGMDIDGSSVNLRLFNAFGRDTRQLGRCAAAE